MFILFKKRKQYILELTQQVYYLNFKLIFCLYCELIILNKIFFFLFFFYRNLGLNENFFYQFILGSSFYTKKFVIP